MRNTLRSLLTAVLSVVMILGTCTAAFADYPYPQTVPTTAEGYVIYDATDGKVILGKEAETKFYPASITKVMTALLVCENITDLDSELTFTQAALDEMTNDSSMLNPKAQVGEKMSVRDALMGMFLISSNECAAQLGITVAGSRAAFADMMNEKAREIGCKNTHFVNAHGLHDDNHYTTPEDMALIWTAGLKNQAFLKTVTTYNYTIQPTNMDAEARELGVSHSIVNGTIPYAEVYAGKTGRTPVAGRTLCTVARFNGHDVVIVIMKSTDDEFYNDTLLLLEYARGYFDGLYTDMTWTEKEETLYVYPTNSLKVREYPSTVGTKVVGTLKYAQQVKRVATWGEWSMIEYMNQYYYVFSSYLSEKEPDHDYNPNDNIPGSTRETLDIDVITSTTLSQSTTGSQTEATSSEEEIIVPRDDDDETYTRLENVSVDDGSNHITEGSKGSIVKVVLIICIGLMIVVAAAFVIMTVNDRKRRRRRRHRINTDEWYK